MNSKGVNFRPIYESILVEKEKREEEEKVKLEREREREREKTTTTTRKMKGAAERLTLVRRLGVGFSFGRVVAHRPCRWCKARSTTREQNSSTGASKDQGRNEGKTLGAGGEGEIDMDLVITEEEERESMRKVIKLLYSGDRLEEEVHRAIETGDVDERTLQALKRRISRTRERDDLDKLENAHRALTLLYEKLSTEFNKRSLTPSMKLLSECLDVLLEEEEDETERLLKVKDLLDKSFLEADLGLDALSAASLFAQARDDHEIQNEIDSYMSGRLQKDAFLSEVGGRLDALKREFELAEEQEASQESWIDGIENRNRKSQRDKIVKYMNYIIDLAKNC